MKTVIATYAAYYFSPVLKSLDGLRRDERGLTATEYALCAALIGGVIIAAFQLLGTNIAAVINAIANIIGENIPTVGGGGETGGTGGETGGTGGETGGTGG